MPWRDVCPSVCHTPVLCLNLGGRFTKYTPPVCPSVCPSACPSVCLSVCPSVRPSVCPMPTVNSKTEHRIAFKISVEDTDTRKGVSSLALIHTRVLRSPHWVELMVTPLVVNSSSSSSTCIVFLSYLFCATILLGETNKLILLASSNRK